MPIQPNYRGPQGARAALTTPEREKVQSARDKLNSVLTRAAATSEPLTVAEWTTLNDADGQLLEALGVNANTTSAVYARRAFVEKLHRGLR